MATLQELQAQLEAKELEIKNAQEAKIERMKAARQAEEAAKIAAEEAKSDEQKAAELQAKIDALSAHLTQIQQES